MRKLHITAILLLTTCVTTACGTSTADQETERVANEAELAAAAADEALNRAEAVANRSTNEGVGNESAKVSLSANDKIRACKAGIAILMGKKPTIMRATVDGDIVHNQYKRPDDGTLWKQDCRIDGNRIHWRSVDAVSGAGRWRDTSDDEVLTFSLDGEKVRVTETYSDGSKSEEVYKIKS